MKSVLISIQPKWCELIANGKKTIEAHKTRPKIDAPFKCYIYKTKKRILRDITRKGEEIYGGWDEIADKTRIISCPDLYGGKVIGEFVCDRIDDFSEWQFDYPALLRHINALTGFAGDYGYFDKYLGGKKKGYGWHISNLKIYDTPKELGEFCRRLPDRVLESGDYDCRKGEAICIDYPEGGDLCEQCIFGGRAQLTRPPQSWFYLEE